jgi:hypothetical protein
VPLLVRANPPRRASRYFGQHSFHMILSTAPLHQDNPLLVEQGDSNCTVFNSCPVEDGCSCLSFVAVRDAPLSWSGTRVVFPKNFCAKQIGSMLAGWNATL